MMETPRVRFDNPPVVEVVCGVLFRTPTPLTGAHIGLYWDTFKDRETGESEFPTIAEQAPLSPVVESFGLDATLELRFGDVPPLRRSWLISPDGRNLLQIQEDRFLFNWKKADQTDDYPSYDAVIRKFEDYLDRFVLFLEEKGIGKPEYRQFELTYVNQILLGDEASPITVHETSLLVDHLRDKSPTRFLGEPQSINWMSVYDWPDRDGRLHIIAQSGRAPEGKRILRLDLTARGIPADTPEQNRRTWFDKAHDWITRGFADITARDVQEKIWGRTS